MTTLIITSEKTDITSYLSTEYVSLLQNIGNNIVWIEEDNNTINLINSSNSFYLKKTNSTSTYYVYTSPNVRTELTITKAAYQTDGGGSGGDITAGTGLVFDGNVLNHSNSVQANTNNTLKTFKYDTEGHITEGTDIDVQKGLSINNNKLGHTNSTTGAEIGSLSETDYKSVRFLFDNYGHITAGVSQPLKTNDNFREPNQTGLFTVAGAYDLYNSVVSGGDIVAGTGLVLDGNTMNHINAVEANTNNTLKTFKYDTEGHITEGTDISLSNDLQLNNNTISIKTNDNYTTEGETGIFTTQGAHALFLESSGGGGIQTYIKDTPVDINNYLASLPQDISFIATLSSNNTGELVNLIGTESFYIIHFKTNTNEWLELAYTYPSGSLAANRTKNSWTGGITNWVAPGYAIPRQSSIVWDDRYINASSSSCSLFKSFRTVSFSFQLEVSGTISEGYTIGTLPRSVSPNGTNYRVIGYDSNKNILFFYITISGNIISKQNIEVNQTIYCSGCFITNN